MKVLLTGHQGYLGTVMAPVLQAAGHEVTGLDIGWFADCVLGPVPTDPPGLRIDLRDVTAADLEGFDAVIHLAALSNDPLGHLAPEITYDINHAASVRLARLAKQAGVGRFLYSSTCSVYGAAGGKTAVPMSRPSMTIPPSAPKACCWAVRNSRTKPSAAMGLTKEATSIVRISFSTFSPLR